MADEHHGAPVLPADQAFRFFTFTFENDIFVGEDDGFTNGMGFTLGRGPFPEFNRDSLPGWLLPIIRRTHVSRGENKRRGVSHTFYQVMQTPQDITLSEPPVGDLPYAGLLGWRGTFLEYDNRLSDQLSLDIGILGPASLAEQAQSIIHTITGSEEPQGWDTQLENELVASVEARRVLKIAHSSSSSAANQQTDADTASVSSSVIESEQADESGSEPSRFSWDLLGVAGASLGTLQSATGVGLAFRWGTNLDYTHSTFALEADRQVNALAVRDSNGFYAYLGARAGVVFNDVLVEGNTFTDSRSASLEHFQNQVSAGLVWSLGKLAYVLQFSSFTSPVETIDKREKYGALSVTFSY